MKRFKRIATKVLTLPVSAFMALLDYVYRERRIITRIQILLVPVGAAALHYLYLDPFLMEIGTAAAAKYSHVITLVIIGALLAAIFAVLED